MPSPKAMSDADSARTRLFLSAAYTSRSTGRRVTMDSPDRPARRGRASVGTGPERLVEAVRPPGRLDVGLARVHGHDR
jgi:hypothetical protein